MALLTCPDCQGKVSDAAPTCPHCGRPMKAAPVAPPRGKAVAPAKQTSGCAKVAAGFIGLIVLLVIIGNNSDKPAQDKAPTAQPASGAAPAPEPAKPSDADCAKDLHCAGEKHSIHASVYCKDKIEARAAHDVKWSDGMFSPSMSRYRWGNKDHTSITYIGDKVAFQNGFGAFTPMTYFCTVDVATDAILDVQVMEGRLPSD